MSSGQGANPNWRYSPRAQKRMIWCDSKTNSTVWMGEDIKQTFMLAFSMHNLFFGFQAASADIFADAIFDAHGHVRNLAGFSLLIALSKQ